MISKDLHKCPKIGPLRTSEPALLQCCSQRQMKGQLWVRLMLRTKV